MRRAIWILLPLIVSVILLVVVATYLTPMVKNSVISKIQNYAAENLPLDLKISKIEFNFFNPQVELKDIELKPKTEKINFLSDIKISNVSVDLDFFSLIVGQFKISAIQIKESNFTLHLDPILDGPSNKSKINSAKIFSVLDQIPIENIFLQKVDLLIKSEKLRYKAQLKINEFLTQYKSSTLKVKSQIDGAVNKDDVQTLDGKVFFAANANKENINISSLEIKNNLGNLSLTGKVTDLDNILISPRAEITSSSDINLNEAESIINHFTNSPKLRGNLGSQVSVVLLNNEISAKFTTKFINSEINQFKIGNSNIEGTFKNKELSINLAEIEHPSGRAKIEKFILNFQENNKTKFSGTLKTEELNMKKLFESIGLNGIPVEFNLIGNLPCSGEMSPNLNVNCNGRLDANHFSVKAGNNDDAMEIVNIPLFSAEGKLNINNENVNYDAKVFMGDSQGHSNGSISYKDGFEISFETPDLAFKNIKNLANLRFEGGAAIIGSTKGNSAAATFDLKMDAHDFVFENYILGQVSSDINYNKGTMTFANMQGHLNQTKYDAHLILDIPNKRVKADGKIPFLDTRDTLQMFSRILKLPIEVQSTGTAAVSLEGPLKLNELSYDFSVNLFKGNIAGENFDRAEFSVHSINGNVSTDKVFLQKNNSRITLVGKVDPKGESDIQISGNNLRLEESENISKILTNVSGDLNFNMSMKGFILTPDTLIKGSVTNLLIEDHEVQNSDFNIKLYRQSLEGTTNIMDGIIKADFKIPYTEDLPFHLKLQTQNWNFAKIIALMSKSQLYEEFDSALSTQIDLSSNKGGFLKSNGNINISKFFLKREQLSVKNPNPVDIKVNEGKFQISNFKLIGPSSTFEIVGKEFTTKNLDVFIEGRTQARLLQIFLPFLEDLSGIVSTQIKITGDILKPQILGNANIQNALVKLKKFPHPFEKLNTDITFSQSKININSIKGYLASGALSGEGSIIINGPRNIPMNIKAQLVDANFNIPENIRTSGDANITLTGKWFPFTLSGTYRVFNGFVDKDFAGGDGQKNSAKQSAYLPKVLLESNFDPLALDMQVSIEKPLTIKNPQLQGQLSGNIQIKGPVSNPLLFGKIVTEKNTKLLFRDKIFEITNAYFTFNDPKEINPELFISGRARVSDYDINLLAQGNSKSPIFKLNSTPPLSEQDIISLLALGITSSNLDKNVQSSEQAANTSYQIGAAIISQNPLTKELSEKLGLNIQFSSSYDDTKNIAVPKISASRQLTTKLNFSASRSLGEENSTEVKAQYFFNPNVSAVGSWEGRDNTDKGVGTRDSGGSSVLGLDLDFRREFK